MDQARQEQVLLKQERESEREKKDSARKIRPTSKQRKTRQGSGKTARQEEAISNNKNQPAAQKKGEQRHSLRPSLSLSLCVCVCDSRGEQGTQVHRCLFLLRACVERTPVLPPVQS